MHSKLFVIGSKVAESNVSNFVTQLNEAIQALSKTEKHRFTVYQCNEMTPVDEIDRHLKNADFVFYVVSETARQDVWPLVKKYAKEHTNENVMEFVHYEFSLIPTPPELLSKSGLGLGLGLGFCTGICSPKREYAVRNGKMQI